MFIPDEENIQKAFVEIDHVLSQADHRRKIMILASKYRSFKQVEDSYQYFLSLS